MTRVCESVARGRRRRRPAARPDGALVQVEAEEAESRGYGDGESEASTLTLMTNIEAEAAAWTLAGAKDLALLLSRE